MQPPKPSCSSTLLFMCLFAVTKAKTCPDSLPPTTRTVLYFHTARFHNPPSAFFFLFWRVSSSKLQPCKRARLCWIKEVCVCFSCRPRAQPPRAETTRLSFLLGWLQEGPVDQSHASKCLLLMMTMPGYLQQIKASGSKHMCSGPICLL